MIFDEEYGHYSYFSIEQNKQHKHQQRSFVRCDLTHLSEYSHCSSFLQVLVHVQSVCWCTQYTREQDLFHQPGQILSIWHHVLPDNAFQGKLSECVDLNSQGELVTHSAFGTCSKWYYMYFRNNQS